MLFCGVLRGFGEFLLERFGRISLKKIAVHVEIILECAANPVILIGILYQQCVIPIGEKNEKTRNRHIERMEKSSRP